MEPGKWQKNGVGFLPAGDRCGQGAEHPDDRRADPLRRYAWRTIAGLIKLAGHMITETGLEDFSIGMKQFPTPPEGFFPGGRPGQAGNHRLQHASILRDCF